MNWLKRVARAIDLRLTIFRYRHAVTEEDHHRKAGRHERASEYADIARHIERQLEDDEHEAMNRPSPLFGRK